MTERKKILIVDDEPHIVNLVKLSLEKQRYDVIGAYSAREGLKATENNDFDLIITNLMMPGINGYEFCQAIRSKTKTRSVPIVILSGKNLPNDKLHAIDVGADDYITKPFDPIELERRVKLNLTCSE